MTQNDWVQIIVYFVVLILLVKPLGAFMARVFLGESTFLDRIFKPVERLLYRLAGIDPQLEMDWKIYALSVLLFSVIGILFLYILQRIQGFLPLNPAQLSAVPSALALNTAVSFITNTNWQNYGGESTMS